MKILKKKSQVWYIDFMVGLLIFIIALVIYYEYSTNLSKQEKGLLDEILADAKSISSSLVSAGYPFDWNSGDVERIGITNNDQRIDNEKLEEFYDMTYNQSRRLFGTRFDYFIFFKNKNNSIMKIDDECGVGNPNVVIEESEGNCISINITTNPKELVGIKRLLIYNSDVIKMEVYVWE